LGRTQHTIFHNHIRDELVLPQPWAGAILTFAGDANGEVAPIRIIRGSNTGLALSDQMTVDPINNEYWVPAGQGRDLIHVFDALAEGNAAPLRVIRGAGGRNPSVDYEHDVFLTRKGGVQNSRGARVQVFDRTLSGDLTPLREITGGPLSGHNGPDTPYWIPGTRNFLASTRPFGANTYGDRPGAPTNYQTVEEALTYVGVWSIDDSGDVAPRYTIAHDILKEFRGVAINQNHKEIMMADKTGNAVYTFSFPEAWETFEPVTAPMGPTGEDPNYNDPETENAGSPTSYRGPGN
jgi:hypothetical protein